MLLDRRIERTTGTFAGGNTTWTLPYAVATNGSEGVVRVVNQATGVAYTPTTRPTSTTVTITGANLSATPVYIGIQYEFSYTFSPLFLRRSRRVLDDQIETRGRLQMRFGTLRYNRSLGFTVAVTPEEREAYSYVFTASTPEDGEFRVPLQTRNKGLDITITSNTDCAFHGFEWEGYFHTRSRRV